MYCMSTDYKILKVWVTVQQLSTESLKLSGFIYFKSERIKVINLI